VDAGDVKYIIEELLLKILRVRLRWYLERSGVKAEEAGYCNAAEDHATHMDLVLAMSIGR